MYSQGTTRDSYKQSQRIEASGVHVPATKTLSIDAPHRSSGRQDIYTGCSDIIIFQR